MISKIVNFFDEGTGGADHPVYIGQLKLGTVVQSTYVNEIGGREPSDSFGHIVGFARNRHADTLMRVQWDWEGGTITRDVHPAELILLLCTVR